MDKKFSSTLRNIREKRNISQSQLAELMGVDRSAIAHWESGDRFPSTKLLVRLSEVLDVDMAVLIQEQSEDKSSSLVMIVDDEAIALQGAKKVVTDSMPEATVVTFKRCSDAIEYAGANNVTLALLDIEMGKANGFDLSKKLHDINPSTNIIFLTAYPDYALDAWATTANGFLVKPLKKEELQRALDTLRTVSGS